MPGDRPLRGHTLLGGASGLPATPLRLSGPTRTRVSPSNHWTLPWLKDVPGGSCLINPPRAPTALSLKLSLTNAVQLRGFRSTAEFRV